MAKDALTPSNSKHIGIRHRFFRESDFKGDISIQRVASEYQFADVVTKPLTRDFFVFHHDFLMNLEKRQVWRVSKREEFNEIIEGKGKKILNFLGYVLSLRFEVEDFSSVLENMMNCLRLRYRVHC